MIAADDGSVSATGDDDFGSAFGAYVSFSDCVGHWYNLLVCSLQLDLFEIRRDYQFRFSDGLDILRGKARVYFF